MRYLVALFVILVPLLPLQALANDCGGNRQQTDFFRDDLSALKDRLRGVIAALGEAPAPYAKESEDWSLPAYACADGSGFFPISASYRASLTTDAQQKQLEQDFQKQLMEAQAKGDYDAIAKLSQDMQAKAMAMAQANQQNQPIQIGIQANGGGGQTIDPDTVVRDGVGFIALKDRQGGISSGEERITFYFDKVALKDAQRIASFDLGGDQRVPGKRDLINLRVDISGPTPTVEAMATGLDTNAVLQQLDDKRTMAR